MNRKFHTVNPFTEKALHTYTYQQFDEADRAVHLARKAYNSWKKTSLSQRAEILTRLADQLENEKEKLSVLMTNEMGKPLVEGRAEISKCALTCRYFAEEGPAFLEDQVIRTEASRSYVSIRPMGVIFAIMPWNYPFWQVIRFLAPSIMLGNTALLKHAPNTTACALEIERMVHDSGFPKDGFRTLIIDLVTAGEVIDHPLVQAITLTGSTKAGKAVAARAGAALKKTVLELGGSDPYVVLKDANLKQAAEQCVAGRMKNSGQSCIAAKRFIVEETVLEEFTAHVIDGMNSYQMGDPLEESTNLGPLARADLRDTLHGQVTESVRNGADCLLGGEIPERSGYFYPPTVLTNVKKGMPAYHEELFGPVASIISAENEDMAIEIANDSVYGLGASIFSSDSANAEEIIRDGVDAGACFVNEVVNSDPRVPFGGVKNSGYGRELSKYGMLEFANLKTVWVK
jgi:succinate-semialdehyde dehydrogenase/glutarate-semialdehyde dehydrogenase